MKENIEDFFQMNLFRPIDPFLKEYYSTKNIEISKNQILDYSEEVKHGMRILKSKKIIIPTTIFLIMIFFSLFIFL